MAEPRSIPTATRHNQALATDPQRSAWVTANAGSGKTYVLSRRVIRLMLDGVAPAQILCLTFTKAAAAEMSNRIFETLSGWASLDEDRLSDELRELLGHEPTRRERERSRTLFALALDTPGGLKIQTIHAFCEALLHQFPLEANMSGHFQVIEEDIQNELIELARQQVFAFMESGESSSLRDALETLLESASDNGIEKALTELIKNRTKFLDWINDDLEAAIGQLWQSLALRPGIDRMEIIETGLAQTAFDRSRLAAAVETSHEIGGPNNFRFVEAVASGPDLEEMFKKRVDCLLTKDLDQRKTPVTKPVFDNHPELREILESEAGLTIEICENLKALHLIKASEALFIVGKEILDIYQRLKNARGLADFNDLIQAANRLLTRSDIQQWVRYKLDRGIDHVLVDEAQDTSPDQWAIINAITDEFHCETGLDGKARSVFVVGDEKQSIYSFQGADPQEFAFQARTLEKKSLDFKKPFSSVPLEVSFRSSPDILDAVDKVFSISENFRGLSQIDDQTTHESIYQKVPGEVQIWPLYKKQEMEEQTSWLAPVDAAGLDDPAVLLARRISTTIKQWLDKGEWLAIKGRKIRCGDILILVRRRDKFTQAVLRELKRAGLAIAGADRLNLTDHIAIEDLMALGRFVLMREDDLSLAGVLKSPLFGFDDDMLTEIAAGRDSSSLFEEMENRAEDQSLEFSERLRETVARLKALEALARRVRPFEFYSHLLGREGGRKAFVSHLGREAEEVIDAFLQAALDHEKSGSGSLEEFLIRLELSSPEIKREVDMNADEIRVITVHSAKGLEAPVVFLVDPCTPAFLPAHRPPILEIDADTGKHAFLWVPKSGFDITQTRSRLSEIKADAEEEYRRLLYVAMTRAADRLIVCGWHGVKEIKHDHWHSMISRALEEDAKTINPDSENEYLAWHSPKETIERRGSGILDSDEAESETGMNELPDWLQRDLPRERETLPSITPSQLSGSDAGQVQPNHTFPVDDSELQADEVGALSRGLVIHKLLELLPTIEAGDRRAYARNWLEENLAGYSNEEAGVLAAGLCNILANNELAALFAPYSQGETAIAGIIDIAGKKTRITGRIDRLANLPEKVVIADYKTNANPPNLASEIPEDYIVQLALYRQVIGQVQPEKPVECMLIWTQNGSVMTIDEAELDRAFSKITLD
ncbi:MAG: double-strand break repair helicase AddA [Rhizobiaceae bacterium]